MMEDLDVSASIEAKSDQLNAADLMGGIEKVITVSRVEQMADKRLVVHYQGDDGRPFKPCKTMARLLVACYGPNAKAWVGKSLALYRDESVKYAGDDVGGIRIRAVTDIERPKMVKLPETRGKTKAWKVEVLSPPKREPYPADLFAEKLPVILETIEAGKMTAEQAISRLEQTGTLTDEQRAAVRQEVAV